MLRNDTSWTFQLRVRVGDEDLEGEWRSDAPPDRTYEIVERNHEICGEYWGGYTRSNRIFRRTYGKDGALWGEELVAANAAVMMYEPFLEGDAMTEGCGGI
jgi:vancomycin resistance protein VanW